MKVELKVELVVEAVGGPRMRVLNILNPQGQSQLIGVVDSASLCVRSNDGKTFRYANVEITHSFDTKPLVLIYEIEAGWQEYFAK